MTNTENLSINRSRCSRSRCFPPSVLLYSCLDEIHVCASLFLLICITYAPLYKGTVASSLCSKKDFVGTQQLQLSFQQRAKTIINSSSLRTCRPPADRLLHTCTNSHYNEVFGDVMRLSVNIYVSFC